MYEYESNCNASWEFSNSRSGSIYGRNSLLGAFRPSPSASASAISASALNLHTSTSATLSWLSSQPHSRYRGRWIDPTLGDRIAKSTDRNRVVLSQFIHAQDILRDYKLNQMPYYRNVKPFPLPYKEEMEAPLRPQNLVGISHLSRNVGGMLEGKVFLCRSITPATKNVFVSLAVEDPDGRRGIFLDLDNYSLGAHVGHTDFNQVIPPGSFLAVKNPHFQVSSIPGRDFSVKCLNPADVELLSLKKMKSLFPGVIWKSSPPLTIAGALNWSGSDSEVGAKLERLGNQSFDDKRWTDALRWYTLALDYITPNTDNEEGCNSVTNNTHLKIVRSKAAAYLSMGCYNKALESSEIVLNQNGSDRKAICLKARALVELRRYRHAAKYLRETCTKNDLEEDTELSELQDTISRLWEQAKNREVSPPNLSSMVITALGGGRMETSRVPEITSSIEIADLGCKGLGYIATEIIPPGQLIMCTKGFVSFFTENTFIGYLQGRNTGILQPAHDALVSEISNKLTFEPQLGEGIYQVWAGRRLGRLIAASDEDRERMQKVDLERIEAIVQIHTTPFICKRRAPDGRTLYGFGIWNLNSYFNHSCSSANATAELFEDLLITRALREIKVGEEVIVSYMRADKPLSERSKYFSGFEFECVCDLCALEAAEPRWMIHERQEILSWLSNYNGGFDVPRTSYVCNPQLLEIGLNHVLRLIEMRKGSPTLNPCLGGTEVLAVGLGLYNLGEFLQALHLLIQLLEGVRRMASMSFKSVPIMVNILKCCVALRDKTLTEKWTLELKHLLRCTYGSVDAVKALDAHLVPSLKTMGINY